MTTFIKNLIIWGAISTAWIGFSAYINGLVVWNYLTQFFVFIRTLVKPTDFFWNFDVSVQIITLVLQILIAYSILQVIFVLRDNFNK